MFLGVCDEILINLNPFGVYPTALIAHEKLQDPYISPKKNSSDYRVHGTQNDRLESRVSMQKSVWKNMHRVLRYWQKCIQHTHPTGKVYVSASSDRISTVEC